MSNRIDCDLLGKPIAEANALCIPTASTDVLLVNGGDPL